MRILLQKTACTAVNDMTKRSAGSHSSNLALTRDAQQPQRASAIHTEYQTPMSTAAHEKSAE
jgi:hypothetical protein